MSGPGTASLHGRERGSALLPVLLLMFLFAAVSMAIAVAVQIEIKVASRHVAAASALYAADAGIAAAIAELRGLPSWAPVLSGTVRSVHTDGVFGGVKPVPGGGTVLICCGMQSAIGRLATDTSSSARTARRNIEWQPFLWVSAHVLLPGDPPSRSYVIVWVADDEEDDDGDAQVDANGIVVLRAEANEASGVRRVTEAYVARQPVAGAGGEGEDEVVPQAVGVRAWREVR